MNHLLHYQTRWTSNTTTQLHVRTSGDSAYIYCLSKQKCLQHLNPMTIHHCVIFCFSAHRIPQCNVCHIHTHLLSTITMATVTLPDLNTTIDPSTDLSIIERLESFLYTPMGVGTPAAVAVIITSLVWLVGCCVYCCCRWRRSSEEGGVTVANRDLMFLDIGPTEPVHNGTMSSGYNTGPQTYTTSNSYNNPMERNGSTAMLHTSLDSVISVDRY